MPKFNVSVTFSLTTEVEPELSRHTWDTDTEGVSDFNDESYFQRHEADADGGELHFVVEAEDEDAARDIVTEHVIADGNEVEDDTGLTWQVDSVDIEVEEIEEEMTKEQAIDILRQLIDTSYPEGDIRKALHFALSILLSTPFDS